MINSSQRYSYLYLEGGKQNNYFKKLYLFVYDTPVFTLPYLAVENSIRNTVLKKKKKLDTLIREVNLCQNQMPIFKILLDSNIIKLVNIHIFKVKLIYLVGTGI